MVGKKHAHVLSEKAIQTQGAHAGDALQGLHFIHLGKETAVRVLVSCLTGGHRSLLVSVPLERSGVTDVGGKAMDHGVAEEKHTKVSSEGREERKES